MSHFEAPSSVAGDDVEHHHAPTIRVIAKMGTGPKISFQISNPNRTQPTVPSPDQMAYATPSGMYLRSKSHADKPLGQTSCSTVAVHGVRRHPGIYLIFYVLPANRRFLRADERTRTADLLITSLLAYVLARPTASGNCAYLSGFRRSGGLTLSSAY
jgi:hypothetical protein